MTRPTLSFWGRPAFSLLALGALLFTACDSATTLEEATPRTGRGAIRSVTLLEEQSAAALNTIFANFGLPLGATYNVATYKIVYETIDVRGQVTQASGAVVLPTNAPGNRPMMSYQHGSLVARDAAPSAGGGELVVGLVFAADGYVAVLPDLLGLGDSPGLHPYVLADASASAVVDMLRAVQDFAAEEGVRLNGQFFLTGYSQGGYTAMAAHREIETNLSDELTVTASAPMAGPYDLSGVMAATFTANTPHPSPYYLPYTLLAYNDAYALYDAPAAFLAAPYDVTLPPLFDGTNGSGVINNAMPAIPRDVLQADLLAAFETDPAFPLRQRLRENDVYDWTPRAPMQLYHCAGEDQVPPENTQVAFRRFQERGATQVEFIDPLPTADHGGCVGPSLFLAKLWFDGMVTASKQPYARAGKTARPPRVR